MIDVYGYTEQGRHIHIACAQATVLGHDFVVKARFRKWAQAKRTLIKCEQNLLSNLRAKHEQDFVDIHALTRSQREVRSG